MESGMEKQSCDSAFGLLRLFCETDTWALPMYGIRCIYDLLVIETDLVVT